MLLGWRSTWPERTLLGQECEEEIEDAVECYALGKPTASVFHSMRVAEFALRGLGRKLRIQIGGPIELATLGAILERVRTKVGEARSPATGKTPKNRDAFKAYSDIAAQLEYLKPTRDEVAHNRKRFTGRDAQTVMDRVRALLEATARVASARSAVPSKASKSMRAKGRTTGGALDGPDK